MMRWLKDRERRKQIESLAAEWQAQEDIRRLMEVGDEEGYVALVKALKPEITPDELVNLIEKFRLYRRSVALGETIPS
ncbi:MAG TPA: hypothetical protein VFU55_01790 [Terracidiphilus sp.]|nr:hypothetical protein [Terracidiphilus sp.]